MPRCIARCAVGSGWQAASDTACGRWSRCVQMRPSGSGIACTRVDDSFARPSPSQSQPRPAPPQPQTVLRPNRAAPTHTCAHLMSTARGAARAPIPDACTYPLPPRDGSCSFALCIAASHGISTRRPDDATHACTPRSAPEPRAHTPRSQLSAAATAAATTTTRASTAAAAAMVPAAASWAVAPPADWPSRRDGCGGSAVTAAGASATDGTRLRNWGAGRTPRRAAVAAGASAGRAATRLWIADCTVGASDRRGEMRLVRSGGVEGHARSAEEMPCAPNVRTRAAVTLVCAILGLGMCKRASW